MAVAYQNYFELIVDTDLIVSDNAGNHTMKVTLKDDQTVFVFAAQVYTFFLVIEYEALPISYLLNATAGWVAAELDLEDLDDIVVAFQLDVAESEFEPAIEFSDTLLNSTARCLTLE